MSYLSLSGCLIVHHLSVPLSILPFVSFNLSLSAFPPILPLPLWTITVSPRWCWRERFGALPFHPGYWSAISPQRESSKTINISPANTANNMALSHYFAHTLSSSKRRESSGHSVQEGRGWGCGEGKLHSATLSDRHWWGYV